MKERIAEWHKILERGRLDEIYTYLSDAPLDELRFLYAGVKSVQAFIEAEMRARGKT